MRTPEHISYIALKLFAAILLSEENLSIFKKINLKRNIALILVYNILMNLTLALWREEMPYYDYLCLSCNKKFSVKMTIKERDSSKAKCPDCGSEKVEQQWSNFYAITSKKS